MPPSKPRPPRSRSRDNEADAPGLAARHIAADLLDRVLRQRQSLDDQLDGRNAHPGLAALDARDRALVRRLVGTVLRRLGSLRALLSQYLADGPPSGAPLVETALLLGAAQILWLDVPDHAAVDLSVRLARGDRRASHYASLVNAVLRRVARERPTHSPDADTPPWLLARWRAHYGEDVAAAVAAANAHEPSLDLTVKGDPQPWAEALGGRVLLGDTVRLIGHGPVSQLAGFAEGAWWVQDVAAAIPVRLLGPVAGLRVADLCAAPGGKTAQLAAAGASVVAVDQSANRLARVQENLTRLGLAADLVAADATTWDGRDHGAPFDAILLDAPCTSTGTIRRHPDIPWLKRDYDVMALAKVQARLIRHAVTLLKPGGTLVFCTCSLEPEEGEAIVASLLAETSAVARRPIEPSEVAGHRELISPLGDLRTLPCHLPDPEPLLSGMDGFFAARLVRA